ncbi:PDZ domain containing protein [Trichuris trichiura]|uniref:PDZ domain containing protein n=1 Tax=Trichuris trichiura TaxID=36087 RepID=A0A077Z1S6_TRITR|nr:PDZ domain containing protein [Trichuris trichiura]
MKIVNGTSLIGLDHVEALDCLLKSGEVLQLTLARYHPESKTYKQLVEMASQKISDSGQQFSCGARIQADFNNKPQNNGERSNQPSIKGGKLPSKTLQEWETLCGPEYKILLVKLERSPYNETLGIALEGTVDVVGESETCPHHFIRSVEPSNGMKVLSGELKPGDELLEVNNEVLYGRSYVEVLEILQNLPRQVTMTVGRNALAAPLNNESLGAVTSCITTSEDPKPCNVTVSASENNDELSEFFSSVQPGIMIIMYPHAEC